MVEVHKFEPTQADSNRYNLTGNSAKVFPVFVEDMRDVLRAVDFVDQAGRARVRRAAPVGTLEPAVQRCMATSQAIHRDAHYI